MRPDTTPTSERTQPARTEIEEALLGALLFDGEAMERVYPLLDAAAFYKPNHRRYYAAMCDLYEDQNPIGPVNVLDRLTAKGKAEDEDAYNLTTMAGDVSTSASAEYHAELVRDAFIRRQIIGASSQMAERAYDMTEDLDGLVGDFGRVTDGFELRRGHGLYTLGEVASKALDRAESAWRHPGSEMGIPFGIHDLDRLTNGMHPGDYFVLAARPGMGKTALALQVARDASMTAPVLFVSREMHPDQLGHRALSLEAQADSHTVRSGRLDQDLYRQLQTAEQALKVVPVHITNEVYRADELLPEARKAKRDHGIGLIIVDYLQLLRPPKGDRYGNREQAVTAISQCLKETAMALDVPVLVLCQLSRAVESRPDKRPKLSDVRESGSIEQDADAVLFLYRPAYYGVFKSKEGGQEVDVRALCELNLAKQRNGPPGLVKCRYWDESGRFGSWTAREDDTRPAF